MRMKGKSKQQKKPPFQVIVFSPRLAEGWRKKKQERDSAQKETIRFIRGGEFWELQKKRKEFLGKPKSFQQEHSHRREKVFIWHPPALLNSKAYNACLDCGEMTYIPYNKLSETLRKEISRIQSAMVERFNKGVQSDGA